MSLILSVPRACTRLRGSAATIPPAQTAPTRNLLLGVLLLAVALSGCATLPGGDTRAMLASVPVADLARIESTAASGDALAAAEAYLALAATSAPPARQGLELRAAEAFYLAGESNRALRTLSGIDSGALNPAGRSERQLLSARAALQAYLPERALDSLRRLGGMGLPPAQRIDRLGLMAAAYRQNGDPVQAAVTLDELDRLLGSGPERLDNQISLLMTLSLVPPAQLEQIQRASGSARLRAWASLSALLARHPGADADLLGGYRQWLSAHRNLVAAEYLPQAYYAALAGDYAAGTNLWALLPRDGRFAEASAAVAGGLRQADENNAAGRRPVVNFASTGGNAAAAYEQAIAAGANLVIGPLQRTEVDTLVKRSQLPVQTLALNRSSDPRALPARLQQFALAPEDEAISAANHAWSSGLRSALLLYPSGAWGERLAGAFRRHWRTLGGEIAGESVYGSTPASMGTAVETLLTPAKGDLIMLIATSGDVRTLWQRLTVANLRGLPVLATSHVHAGGSDETSLRGLYFVDIPWLIRGASQSPASARLRAAMPERNTTLARLYAMGSDSYRLAPHAQAMQGHPGHFFAGGSGGLSLDGTGRVLRELSLARFGATGPVALARIGDSGE